MIRKSRAAALLAATAVLALTSGAQAAPHAVPHPVPHAVPMYAPNLVTPVQFETTLSPDLDSAIAPIANEVLREMRAGNWDAARRLLDQALAQAPDSADLWRLSGQLELLRGRTQEAEQQFQRAEDEGEDGFVSRVLRMISRLATRPESNDRIDRDLAGFRVYPLVDRALDLMDEGRYDEAREFLDRAIEIDPDNVVVWTVSGDLELRRGNVQTAREHLDRAVGIDPTYARGRLYRGLALIQLGEYAAAREDLRRSLLSTGLTEDEAQVARETLLSIGGTVPELPTDEPADTGDTLVSADELRSRATDAAAEGNALLAYTYMAALTEPTVEDRMQRADYALTAMEYSASLADLNAVRTDETAPASLRREAALRAATIHHANGQYAQALGDLTEADWIAPLDLDNLRLYVRLSREVGPEALHTDNLARLQRDGMGEERGWAADELAAIHLANGNRAAAREVLLAKAEDETLSDTARANAYTRLAELSDDQGVTSAYLLAAAELRGEETQVAVVETPQEPETPVVTTPVQPVTPRPTRPQPPRRSAADRAYDLAGAGNCESAIPLFASAYEETGNAALLIAEGDCEQRLGNTAAAIRSFEAASVASGLTREQQLYTWRSLAYLYEADPNWTGAERAWRRADQLNPSAEAKYGSGRALAAQGRNGEALEIWAGVEPGDLPADQQTPFAFAQAEAQMALAYAYLAEGNDAAAIPLFERAIATNPTRYYRATEDLAYAYMREGRYEEAAFTFRDVVDNREYYPQSTDEERRDLEAHMYRVRREVTELERDWYAYSALTYREGQGRNTVNVGPYNSGQSQASFEAGWFPEGYGYNVGSGIALYGRVYGTFEDDSLNLIEDSLQGGVGIHYKPFDDIGLILSAERMIQIGDQSRDAWLFTGAYSWSQGTDWRPGESRWPYTTVYGDVAYIPDEPDYFSTSGEVLHGIAFPVGDRTAVIPHGVVAGRYSEDDFQRTSYIEAGPGISLRHWFCEDEYHAPRGTVELQLQYRFMVMDSSNPDITDDGAFVARLVFTY